MLRPILKFYALVLSIAFSIVLFSWGMAEITEATAEPTGISATTEARQTVWFSPVKPNTAYTAYFYAYHYPGDEHPYAVSYSGFSSNAFGQFKASVPVESLAQQYRGGEGPVYSVRVCLLEGLTEIACTPYTYVGFIPSSLWTYHG